MNEKDNTELQKKFELAVQEQIRNFKLFAIDSPESEIVLSVLDMELDSFFRDFNFRRTAYKAAFMFVIARRFYLENQKLKAERSVTE